MHRKMYEVQMVTVWVRTDDLILIDVTATAGVYKTECGAQDFELFPEFLLHFSSTIFLKSGSVFQQAPEEEVAR